MRFVLCLLMGFVFGSSWVQKKSLVGKFTSVEVDEQSANDYQVALDKELLSKGLV